jgi:hypothetical protein
MEQKSVSVTLEQAKWLENAPINFSQFVRHQLDEAMESVEFPDGSSEAQVAELGEGEESTASGGDRTI